ncbi:hypothetical protein AVEN_166451-1 [Araneus ventricosus]|uniref:Transposase Tc1-like domain-containing protein n=1 Tax=Araneus ventricosus TaxID=182803 RepID=A0A4Y2EXR6_ARAVE|nr:hypothetical protein AVEN_166451-1 [Araneus ventricosus]
MERGFTQADAARRLKVWSEDSGISLNLKIRFQEDRQRFTFPAKDCFLALSARRRKTTTVPQLFSDYFVATGTRRSAFTVRRHLHNRGLCVRNPLVSCEQTSESKTEKCPFMLGRKTRYLEETAIGLCALLR